MLSHGEIDFQIYKYLCKNYKNINLDIGQSKAYSICYAIQQFQTTYNKNHSHCC